MSQNLIVEEIIKKIKAFDKIAFFHHINPDGDAIASSYALLKVIQQEFPEKKLVLIGEKEFIESRFSFLHIDSSLIVESIDEDNWLAIVGDTSVKDRVYKYEEFAKAKGKVCFDHHTNDVDFDVDIFWKETHFPAAAIQSWQIASNICTKKIESKTALIFLFGVITDTGAFTYSLNDPLPLKTAIEIFPYINIEEIDQMYKSMRTQTFASLELDKWVLNNFKIQKKLVYCIFRDEDLKKLCIEARDCYNVNRLANIQGILVWGFFIEDKPNNVFRVSLRSNGFSVANFAIKYGGGGHERAAGIKLELEWNKLNNLIEDLVESIV